MHVDRSRTRELSPLRDGGDGPVVYWMSRDQRLQDNWALLYAQERALELKKPLVLLFCLLKSFEHAQRRQFSFLLRGLEELAESAKQLHIPFVLVRGNPGEEVPAWLSAHHASELITDFSPLRGGRKWREAVAKDAPCTVVEVDAHNVVPVWVASAKQEYAAATLRPKIHRLLPEFLTNFPKLKEHPHRFSEQKSSELHVDSWLREWPDKGEELTWIQPGESAAHQALRAFLKDRLAGYAEARNNPTVDGQSNLSPYLHFGMLSAQRVAWEVKHAEHGSQKDRDALLEELIVRKELADNYCLYQHHYDTAEGFPNWAKASLDKHRKDTREYLYSLSEFEHAKTHDPLWNAAQTEMVRTGKMHGYMRMYWAKKILEWTPSPEEAMKIAVILNDTYELDGRDPNGYTGIAWSIGGVHDRPWFDRPVYGSVRYMSAGGAATKFDVKAYIRKFLS